MTVTLPCPDAVLQTAGAVPDPVVDPAVFTDAVARWLERLREFRSRLYGCLVLRLTRCPGSLTLSCARITR